MSQKTRYIRVKSNPSKKLVDLAIYHQIFKKLSENRWSLFHGSLNVDFEQVTVFREYTRLKQVGLLSSNYSLTMHNIIEISLT